MMRRKTTWRAALAAAALMGAGVSTPAHAETIGIDVSGAVYTGAGVLDTTSRTWTSVTTNGSFTLDGRTVNVVYGTHGNGSINDTPAGITLFDSYKFTTGAAFGTVLTNLDPNRTYSVVYYGAQDGFGGRGTTFDLAEPDRPALQTTGDATVTFTPGVNYVRYDFLRPDNSVGDQRIRVLTGIGPDGGVGILNGFEVSSYKYSEVVNVDFRTNGGAYTGTGVLADTGTQWNAVNSTTVTGLLDSRGGLATATATLTGANGDGSIGGSNALTADYYYDVDNDFTLTIGNLMEGRLYDLALFGAQDGFGGRGSTFEIDGYGVMGTNAEFSGLDSAGFELGDTHAIFRLITPDENGQIVVHITQEGANGVSFINGLQLALVAPTPGALPAGLGLLGVLACRRRRRA